MAFREELPTECVSKSVFGEQKIAVKHQADEGCG